MDQRRSDGPVTASPSRDVPPALRAHQRILLEPERIASRVREMGREISRDYGDSRPVLIAVLKGAVVFLSDLSRAVEIPHEIDFLICSSYGDRMTSTGRVVIHHDVRTDLTGRDVLVVEGVVDTGLTLAVILEHLQRHEPRSVRVVTLLDKVPCRKTAVDVHYVGFRIGNEFVVGYGLDYAGYLRNLPHIAVIEEPGAASARPVVLAPETSVPEAGRSA